MNILKFLKFCWLKKALDKRMTSINEIMDLKEVADIYARYVCKMNGWKVECGYNELSMSFCETSFSFMNGYTKALHDNGLEFQNGLVKKRHITKDMPCGALDRYYDDLVVKAQEKAVEVLKDVLAQYGETPANVETIVNTFKTKLKEKNEDSES